MNGATDARPQSVPWRKCRTAELDRIRSPVDLVSCAAPSVLTQRRGNAGPVRSVRTTARSSPRCAIGVAGTGDSNGGQRQFPLTQFLANRAGSPARRRRIVRELHTFVSAPAMASNIAITLLDSSRVASPRICLATDGMIVLHWPVNFTALFVSQINVLS